MAGALVLLAAAGAALHSGPGAAWAAAVPAAAAKCAGEGECPAVEPLARDSVLLQTGRAQAQRSARDVAGSAGASSAGAGVHGVGAAGGRRKAWRAKGVTSDCADRIPNRDVHNAACIVVDQGKALLVKVPYGEHPGWDFPGGWLHEGEFACETAEREACEETGMQVRALSKISDLVFECEVVARNVCTKPVDEGFLERRWVSDAEVDSLVYRGYSWGGQKKALLHSQLQQASAPDWPDVCGCKMCRGEGFSSTAGACRHGKDTDNNEACSCARSHAPAGQEPVDTCGCRVCQDEGWSTTSQACAKGHATDPSEACTCRQRGQGLLQRNASTPMAE